MITTSESHFPVFEEISMPKPPPQTMSSPDARQKALSRWENEGGAPDPGPQEGEASESHELTNAELVQLRIRVIALENVVMALLAGASEDRLQIVREMAAYIAPRPGYTQHPLTVRASAHMIELVHRADHFRPAQA
jgi:hypothetical protein